MSAQKTQQIRWNSFREIVYIFSHYAMMENPNLVTVYQYNSKACHLFKINSSEIHMRIHRLNFTLLFL